MKPENPLWARLKRTEPCVAALGLFDGVHFGHREILTRTCRVAARLGVDPIVFSFRNHPRSVLSREGEPPPRFLVTPERRVELMKELGIKTVLAPEFTMEWAETRADDFARGFLVETLQVRHVVVGFNYCFGRRAEGRPENLKTFGEQLGFTVDVVSACRVNGKDVSSTRIRNAILEGNLDEARELLGRPHELSGTVIRGEGRGKGLGYPTANLDPDLAPLLPAGVYAVLTYFGDEASPRPGMFFLGPRRTFGEKENTACAEVHLFNFEGDLYGTHLRLEILSKLRDGKKFSGPEALIRQLDRDRLDCLRVLENEFSSIAQRGET